MRNKIFTWFFLLFLAASAKAYSQGEINKEPKVFFRNEQSFSGSLSSNGWGFNYRYAKRLNAFSSIIFDGDLASLHHPKEIKSQSPYLDRGRPFVFGKTNEAFSLRGGAGYQKILFNKFDQNGISIRFFTDGGLSLALMKPVYYQRVVSYNDKTGILTYEESLFDPDNMQSILDVLDQMSFFKGIDESKFIPGAFARAGLCFEYGSEDRVIHAIEGGIQLEGFLKKLPILAFDNNQQIMLTLFVTYRFGRVIDALTQK